MEPVNTPSLFGIKHSNRDLSNPESWGKNMFNSNFPISLSIYMKSIGLKLRYLKLNSDGQLQKDFIDTNDLFGCDAFDDDTKYTFEAPFKPFIPYCVNEKDVPKVDVMIENRINGNIYSGFEVKLTAIPDESTYKLDEEHYGSELVIRFPSIIYLACSMADLYKNDHKSLRRYFGNGFGNVSSYVESAQINPILPKIYEILNEVIRANTEKQKPTLIQPVWKTIGKKPILHENCLDVFVWSELAFTKLFLKDAIETSEDSTRKISRPQRAVIQLFFMLNDFARRGQIDFSDIQNKLTYGPKNDKAFSVNGKITNSLMACPELTKPRINKEQIKHIILGGGEKFLSPERRFDATLAANPDLFK
jgi:hypothetical protein